MTDEQLDLQYIRNTIAELPPEQRRAVQIAERQLREVLAACGDIGLLALALLGAEEAAR